MYVIFLSQPVFMVYFFYSLISALLAQGMRQRLAKPTITCPSATGGTINTLTIAPCLISLFDSWTMIIRSLLSLQKCGMCSTSESMNVTINSATEIVVTNDIGGSPTPASQSNPQSSTNETLQLYMLCSGSTRATCQTTGSHPYFTYIGASDQQSEVMFPV